MKWKGLKLLKKEHVAIVFILGVLLMVLALPLKSTEKKDSQKDQEKGEQTLVTDKTEEKKSYGEYLEKRMEEILSRMDGAGKVEVLITMKSSAEQVVAKDKNSTRSVSGAESAESGEEHDENSEETVYAESDEGTVPYIVKEISPAVKGVLVVAEGGEDPVVRQNITEAVMALFSIESHKIKIVRMKEG